MHIRIFPRFPGDLPSGKFAVLGRFFGITPFLGDMIDIRQDIIKQWTNS